jgi:hypothetical protein
MKIEKKNIISDWLNKYGTKEMTPQIIQNQLVITF